MKSIIMNSLNDYQSLFKYEDEVFDEFMDINNNIGNKFSSVHSSDILPRFIVNLNCQNKSIEFSPKMKELKDILLYGIEFSTKTIEYLPEIESVIKTSEFEKSIKASEIVLPTNYKEISVELYETFINESQTLLSKNIDKCISLVEKYLENYKNYQFLVKSDVMEICQEYFNQEHTFEEYLSVII